MDATIRERRIPLAEVGQMLGRARMRQGWRRREAARILGLSPTYLFNLEAGLRCPSVTVAQHLADVLGLSDAERAMLAASAVDDAGADHPIRRAARAEEVEDCSSPIADAATTMMAG